MWFPLAFFCLFHFYWGVVYKRKTSPSCMDSLTFSEFGQPSKHQHRPVLFICHVLDSRRPPSRLHAPAPRFHGACPACLASLLCSRLSICRAQLAPVRTELCVCRHISGHQGAEGQAASELCQERTLGCVPRGGGSGSCGRRAGGAAGGAGAGGSGWGDALVGGRAGGRRPQGCSSGPQGPRRPDSPTLEFGSSRGRRLS